MLPAFQFAFTSVRRSPFTPFSEIAPGLFTAVLLKLLLFIFDICAALSLFYSQNSNILFHEAAVLSELTFRNHCFASIFPFSRRVNLIMRTSSITSDENRFFIEILVLMAVRSSVEGSSVSLNLLKYPKYFPWTITNNLSLQISPLSFYFWTIDRETSYDCNSIVNTSVRAGTNDIPFTQLISQHQSRSQFYSCIMDDYDDQFETEQPPVAIDNPPNNLKHKSIKDKISENPPFHEYSKEISSQIFNSKVNPKLGNHQRKQSFQELIDNAVDRNIASEKRKPNTHNKNVRSILVKTTRLEEVESCFGEDAKTLEQYSQEKLDRMNNRVRDWITYLSTETDDLFAKLLLDQKKQSAKESVVQSVDEAISKLKRIHQNKIQLYEITERELESVKLMHESLQNEEYLAQVNEEILTFQTKIKQIFDMNKRLNHEVTIGWNSILESAALKTNQIPVLKGNLTLAQEQFRNNEARIRQLDKKIEDSEVMLATAVESIKKMKAQASKQQVSLTDNQGARKKYGQLFQKKKSLLFGKIGAIEKIKRRGHLVDKDLRILRKQIQSIDNMIRDCSDYLEKEKASQKEMKKVKLMAKSSSLPHIDKKYHVKINKSQSKFKREVSMALPYINHFQSIEKKTATEEVKFKKRPLTPEINTEKQQQVLLPEPKKSEKHKAMIEVKQEMFEAKKVAFVGKKEVVQNQITEVKSKSNQAYDRPIQAKMPQIVKLIPKQRPTQPHKVVNDKNISLVPVQQGGTSALSQPPPKAEKKFQSKKQQIILNQERKKVNPEMTTFKEADEQNQFDGKPPAAFAQLKEQLKQYSLETRKEDEDSPIIIPSRRNGTLKART